MKKLTREERIEARYHALNCGIWHTWKYRFENEDDFEYLRKLVYKTTEKFLDFSANDFIEGVLVQIVNDRNLSDLNKMLILNTDDIVEIIDYYIHNHLIYYIENKCKLVDHNPAYIINEIESLEFGHERGHLLATRDILNKY